jgi:2-(1,2-epoxy-1,2-dihydrophenyl)acetyl-CoA isomerase
VIESVLLESDGAVAIITLHRPEALNALDEQMLIALQQAVTRVAGDRESRALLLQAHGRGFCAGADLAVKRDSATPPAGDTLRRLYHPVIEGLRSMPKPVVVAVNGIAAGAGMSLAMAGDILVAGESASFAQSFSRVGLVPDAGSSWLLPRAIGEMRARALALLGKRISSAYAQRCGLVWEVVPDEHLRSTALALARELAAMPTQALAGIKRLYEGTLSRDLGSQMALEAELQTGAAQSSDFREGVAAFLEKRKPVFTGE